MCALGVKNATYTESRRRLNPTPIWYTGLPNVMKQEVKAVRFSNCSGAVFLRTDACRPRIIPLG